MDYATKLAIRALVSGLHYAGTIDQRHVAAIIQALGDAIVKAKGDNQTGAVVELGLLREGIARDAQIELPSHD